MKFTKEITFNCNNKEGVLSINCNCQPENNNASKNESCCQVEVVKCESTKDNNCRCEIEINCDCTTSCC